MYIKFSFITDPELDKPLNAAVATAVLLTLIGHFSKKTTILLITIFSNPKSLTKKGKYLKWQL